MDYIKIPMDIENRSFEIIESEIGEHSFTDEELKIVKRVIHNIRVKEEKGEVSLLL